MDSVVAAVENRVHDAILTAIDSVVIPRVEMAVGSITRYSGHVPSSVHGYPVQRNFSWNMEDTPLLMAFSRADLNINCSGNDETRNNETIEDGNFPALNSSYNRQARTHHTHRKILIATNIFH